MEGILNQYLDQIKIGGKQVYKNLALFPHKIFSYLKNFIWTPGRSPALPWPWTARWSISRFLTGLKMSRRGKGFPGRGAFRTGDGNEPNFDPALVRMIREYDPDREFVLQYMREDRTIR